MSGRRLQWKWNPGTFLHQTVCVMCCERERERPQIEERLQRLVHVLERWVGAVRERDRRERERERETHPVCTIGGYAGVERVAVEEACRYILHPLCVERGGERA